MGRSCTVCEHPDRDEIDELVATGALSHRKIAQRFDVSADAVGRHSRGHVSPAIQAVVVEREADRLGSLVDRIEGLIDSAEAILEEAKAGRKPAQALGAIRELRALLELLGKATGELKEGPTVAINLASNPEWLQVQAAIMEALARYPEARIAVAERLQRALPPPGTS